MVTEKVTGLLGDPAFIRAYEEKQLIDKRTRQNQEIGTAVEKAFEKAFENLSGYKIRREPIGSDYIVECDYSHYLLINRENQKKFVIEIKSSRSSEVRMTVTQGKTANDEKENYILCVVPLYNDDISPEMVIQNARFVTNISKLLKTRVEKVKQITDLQDEAINFVEIGEKDVWTSIEGTNIRYVISQKIWNTEEEHVLRFDKFIDGLIVR